MNSKSIRTAVLAVFFLSASVMLIAAQDHAMNMKEHQLTKHEVKALIVGAKTAEDHMKLASYFRGEAQRQEASAKYHDEMAELYKANRTAKVDMAKHCRYFADEARKASEAANSMAGEHEKMAAEARGNASSVQLEPQGLNGTISSYSASAGTATFAFTVAADSVFSSLTGVTSITVFQQVDTQLRDTTSLTNGASRHVRVCCS